MTGKGAGAVFAIEMDTRTFGLHRDRCVRNSESTEPRRLRYFTVIKYDGDRQ
jgi:hypothetical protein